MFTINNQIRILFLFGPTGALNLDNTGRVLNEITVKMGKRWKVFALSGSPQNRKMIETFKLFSCSFELHKIPTWGVALENIIAKILYIPRCFYEGVNLVRRKNIHVIMCLGVHVQNGFLAYVISRVTNRKCIVRVSDDSLLPLIFFLKNSGIFVFRSKVILRIIGFIYRRVENFLLKHVDWVVTHGPMDYDKIGKVTKKVTFVALWIDLERFRLFDQESNRNFKIKLVGEGDKRIILFVGRLHPEKEVETLLKAFKIVYDSYGMSDILLVLVGMGPGNYEEEYKKLASQLGIRDKTYFLGYISHYELPKYYNIADLYVLPSLREEWSNTIMEAMACKVPVIATEVGANPYLVIEKKTGFLVPPKDPVALAKKIHYVLQNYQLAKSLSEQALAEIKKYDKDRIGELYKSVIKKVVRIKESNPLMDKHKGSNITQ